MTYDTDKNIKDKEQMNWRKKKSIFDHIIYKKQDNSINYIKTFQQYLELAV